MTNKVEKGQKYKAGDYTFTVLSDVFTAPNGSEYVAYVSNNSDIVKTSLIIYFENYDLIREPKFKVGDQVAYYGRIHDVVSASDKPDSDGDFWYVIDDGNRHFECVLEAYLSTSKAAE